MKIIEINVSQVVDKEAFERSMAENFEFDIGKEEFWSSLWDAFIKLPAKGRITFHGWAGFEQRMPRYCAPVATHVDGSSRRGEK